MTALRRRRCGVEPGLRLARVTGTPPPGEGGVRPDGGGARATDQVAALATWRTWREAAQIVVRPYHLRRTVTIAVVVGTLLFAINQLDVVLRGDADTGTWVKVAVTYVVPFCVSSAGLLVGTHRAGDARTDG
jgi:hypothetical protein